MVLNTITKFLDILVAKTYTKKRNLVIIIFFLLLSFSIAFMDRLSLSEKKVSEMTSY